MSISHPCFPDSLMFLGQYLRDEEGVCLSGPKAEGAKWWHGLWGRERDDGASVRGRGLARLQVELEQTGQEEKAEGSGRRVG